MSSTEVHVEGRDQSRLSWYGWIKYHPYILIILISLCSTAMFILLFSLYLKNNILVHYVKDFNLKLTNHQIKWIPVLGPVSVIYRGWWQVGTFSRNLWENYCI